MVGGDEDEVLPVIDILRAAGTPLHLGPVGAGQVAKACNQLIVAAEVVALAEASLLAERAGLDVAKLFGLLLGGYASSRVMEVKAHRFATHDHSPSGPAKFMIKDLRAVAEEAEQSGLALVTIEPLRKIFTDLTNAGFGDYDTAVVQRYLEILSQPATGGSPTV
jgi:2-hydroxy-3-oxopropionate reductase